MAYFLTSVVPDISLHLGSRNATKTCLGLPEIMNTNLEIHKLKVFFLSQEPKCKTLSVKISEFLMGDKSN